jgi:hypothetical protein
MMFADLKQAIPPLLLSLIVTQEKRITKRFHPVSEKNPSAFHKFASR